MSQTKVQLVNDVSGNSGFGLSSATGVIHVHKSSSDSVEGLKITNSTTGSTISDGLSIGLQSDEDVFIHNYENTSMIFGTNDTERVRIDQNGRIQKGSASNNLGLATINIVDGNGHSINLSRNQGSGANDDQRLGAIAFHGGLGSQSTTTGGAVIEAFADENQSGSTAATRLTFATKPSGVSPGSAPTERFRINSSGVVQIVSERMAMGTSVTNGGTSDGNFCIEFTGNTRNAMKTRDTDNTGTVNHFVLVSGSAACGTITTTTGQAFFNNLSDYRSKENDVKITDGIEKIKLLRPIRFNYKVDKDTLCDGFFAHEVSAAVPTAVQGEKDAMAKIFYEEGDTIPDGKKIGDIKGYSTTEIDPQMLDTGKIIPLLTAALQEEIAKREALETRVAALEAA